MCLASVRNRQVQKTNKETTGGIHETKIYLSAWRNPYVRKHVY